VVLLGEGHVEIVIQLWRGSHLEGDAKPWLLCQVGYVLEGVVALLVVAVEETAQRSVDLVGLLFGGSASA